jgi:ABC-2 type transport system ATP-binding protein
MEHALKVEGLRRRYPGFTLSDVSFGLERGTVMGFIGRNGAGKTTTIKLIMGLIRKDAGVVEVLGREMGRDDSGIRERIGFVYDEHGFYGSMTVGAIGRMTAPFYQNWNAEEFGRLVRELGWIRHERRVSCPGDNGRSSRWHWRSPTARSSWSWTSRPAAWTPCSGAS